MRRYVYAISLLVAWPLLSQPVLAEEKLSDIWVYYTEDENDAKDTSVNINFGITLDDTVILGFGESKSEFNVRIADVPQVAELTTNQFNIGYRTLRQAPWLISILYEYWGKSSEFEINSVNFNVDYFFSEWVTGLSLQFRNIDIYSRDLIGNERHATTDSYGLGLFVEKDWQNVRWTVYGDWYDYEKDVEKINFLQLLFLRTRQWSNLKSYNHSGALLDWSAGSSLQYLFGDSSVAFRYIHSNAAVDDTDSDIFALSFETIIFDLFLLNMEGGRVFSNPSGQELETDYGVIGLGVKF